MEYYVYLPCQQEKTKEYFYFYLQESSAPLKFQTNPACCPLYSSLYRRSVQRYGQLNLQEKNIKIFIFFYVHNNHSQYCKAIANHVDITYAWSKSFYKMQLRQNKQDK